MRPPPKRVRGRGIERFPTESRPQTLRTGLEWGSACEYLAAGRTDTLNRTPIRRIFREAHLSINPYDEIPYPKAAYSDIHVRRLEASARLFGMIPTPVTHARVLEIGCSAGTNLIPQAIDFPKSEFLGIDLAGDAIAAGRSDISALGLTNIELRHEDLMNIDLAWGQFDYILCHGVFSWVPVDVQRRILQICGACLKPAGVAIITYNTYPGWKIRSSIRDLMLFHVENFEDPLKRIAQARAVLDFVATNCPPDTAYGKVLAEEVEKLRDADDGYLYHEHLERSNNPVYFHQFVERAGRERLQYLANANLGGMIPSVMHKQAGAILEHAPLIKQQQYSDFLLNTSFRKTHLCRADVKLSRELELGILESLHLMPVELPTPVESDPEKPNSWAIKFGARTLRTERANDRAVVQALAKAWPRALTMPELRERVEKDIGAGGAGGSVDFERISQTTMGLLLQGAVTAFVEPPRVADRITLRPEASPFARLQAQRGDRVTNQFHNNVTLDAANCFVLSRLDGRHGIEKLAEDLRAAVAQGKVAPAQKGGQIGELAPEPGQEMVRKILERFRAFGLLVG